MASVDKTYTAVLMTEDGSTYDVSDFVTDLGWEENEKELATRTSFSFAATDSKLASLIKLGCKMFVIVDGEEVVRGDIQENEATLSSSTDQIQVTCYDELLPLEKSEEQFYFASGQTTKSILTSIFKEEGITISKYSGANVKHGKLSYKSGSIADTILDILDDAKKKGGAETLLRATKGKIEVVKFGSNDDIYLFDADDTISAKYKISIANLITKVKIIATSSSSSKKAKVVSTMKGMTQFGIRQKIVTKSKSDKTGEAQKEAKKIMDENGKPEITFTVEAPDVPTIRKGDKEYVNYGGVVGYYYVKEIKHDATNGQMTMTFKSTT